MSVISHIPGSNQNLENANTKKETNTQRNQKIHCKTQQIQTHGEGPRRGWTGDIGGLNFLFFFVFGQFLADQPKQKKQKLQTHGEGPRRGRTEDIDLNFLTFVCFLTGDRS